MTVSEQDANRKPEANSRKDATREPDSSLSAIELALNRLHRSIRLTIQDYLRNFEGMQYPSLEENQRVVSTIQRSSNAMDFAFAVLNAEIHRFFAYPLARLRNEACLYLITISTGNAPFMAVRMSFQKCSSWKNLEED